MNEMKNEKPTSTLIKKDICRLIDTQQISRNQKKTKEIKKK